MSATTEKPWITIDSAQFRRPVEQQVGTTTVVTSTSPYAVPQAVSAYDNLKNYVFEAKYIGPDEPVQTLLENNIRVDYGKNSKRVVRIFLGHEPVLANREAFVAALKNAIQFAMTKANGPAENYEVVMAIVDNNKDRFTLPTLSFDPEK